MSEELKRCPLCGMQANKTVSGGVYCRNYHCGGGALTVAAWNRRALSPAVEALVSAVREYFNPQLGRETQGQEHYTVTQLKAALKRVEEEMK